MNPWEAWILNFEPSVQQERFQYFFKIGRCGFIYPSHIDRHPIIALNVLVVENGLYLIFVINTSDFFSFLDFDYRAKNPWETLW